MRNVLSMLPALLVHTHARHHPFNVLSLSRELREAYAVRHPASAIVLSDPFLVPLALAVEELIGLGPWNRAIRRSMKDPSQDPANPFADILDHFGTPAHVSRTDLDKLPQTGPVIMYGLHPTGPLEVLGAMSLALRRRSDVKVVAVREFSFLGTTSGYFLGADFVSPEPQRTENNRRLREEMKAHLDRGGALIIFPSGKPARRMDGRLWEPPFNPSAAKYGLESDAVMVPFMMDTRLSDAFYRASGWPRFAALFRYALQAREAGRLDFRIGDPVDAAGYKAGTDETAEDSVAVTRFNDLMRSRVDLLAPDYHPGSFTPPTIVKERDAAARRRRGKIVLPR